MCRCRPPQAAAVGYNMRSRVTSGEHGSCRVPGTDTAAVPPAPAGLRPAATIMAPAPDTSVLLPIMWGHSSAGRVAASHAAGRGFEPRCLHHPTVTQSMPHAALRVALCPSLRPRHIAHRGMKQYSAVTWLQQDAVYVTQRGTPPCRLQPGIPVGPHRTDAAARL